MFNKNCQATKSGEIYKLIAKMHPTRRKTKAKYHKENQNYTEI